MRLSAWLRLDPLESSKAYSAPQTSRKDGRGREREGEWKRKTKEDTTPG